MNQETPPELMSEEEKQKKYSNPTNEFNLLWHEINKLKGRLWLLENPSVGLPFLDNYVCKHCTRKYSNYGSIVCGACPKCPYCGKIQGGSWE